MPSKTYTRASKTEFFHRATKPVPGELNDIYQGLISIELTDRMQALKKAVDWYGRAIGTAVVKIPFDRAKSHELAKNAVALGLDNGAHPHEAEQALRTALKIYSSIWPSLPSVQAFYDQLESQRKLLEDQSAAYQAESEPVITHFNGAYRHLGVNFRGRKQAQARDYEGATIWLSYERCRELKQIWEREGLALMLNEEIRTAFVLYGKGHQNTTKLDSLLVLKELKELNRAVLIYGRQQEGFVVAEVPKPYPEAPKPTTGSPGPSKAAPQPDSKVGGLYKDGHITATLYMWLSGGDWHGITEVDIESIPVLMKWLKSIERDGDRTGKWKIEWSGRVPGKVQQIRMVML